MKKLVMATIMLFLSTFFFVTESAYAHRYVQPMWVETFDSGIICTTDGAYTYSIVVVEEDENRKEVATFLAGPNIMQAIIMRSAIMNNLEMLRNHYDGNGVLTLHIRVIFRYPSCNIETRRIKFVQQKTEP